MGTVVGIWRLKTIILLFVIVTLTYTVNGFFGNIETADTVDYNIDNDAIAEDASKSIQDIVFGLGSFLTFGNIDNAVARLILNLFTTSCFIAIGYIVYTFIKEWIPFV